MRQINFNVQGVPTDTPTIADDFGGVWWGTFEGTTRCIFDVTAATTGWQGHLRWAGNNIAFIFPPDGWVNEGEILGLPTLTYRPPTTSLGIQVEGEHFTVRGQGKWLWRGATDMLLPARMRAGEDITPILAQRKVAGANIVRCLGMGFPFWADQSPLTPDQMVMFFKRVEDVGLAVEWVVFAGTRQVMPNFSDQLDHYQRTLDVVRDYPFVLLELLNEYGHSSQQLNPLSFPRPNGVVASHGSGLTDTPPVAPLWSYATYHPRRDAPPDSRGFTNYDPYEFQAQWPKPCPFIPDEGIKPHEYGFDPKWAAQMGAHAATCAGGTFHSDEGVRSLLWPTNVEECAGAFYSATI